MDYELTMVCPITQQILKKPVIAEDEQVYEEEAIMSWLKNNSTSPVTRQEITKKIYAVKMLENIIEDYIKKNPEQKSNQYVPFGAKVLAIKENPGVLFSYTSEEIYNFIMRLYELPTNDRIEIINHFNCYVPIMKYIVNSMDINQEFRVGKLSRRLIHFVCTYATQSVVRYTVERGADLSAITSEGWYPIHLVIQRATADVFEYMCEKDVNLECESVDGSRAIHFASMKQDSTFVQILINKNVNLMVQNNRGYYPLHLACQTGSMDTITLLIERMTDLNVKTFRNKSPMYFLKQNKTITKDEFKILKKRLAIGFFRRIFKSNSKKYSNID
jgi:hypothetical protein